MKPVNEETERVFLEYAELKNLLVDVYDKGGEAIVPMFKCKTTGKSVEITIPRAVIEAEMEKRLHILVFQICHKEQTEKIVF